MKRILITGLSGVGKSTVIAQLSALGYQAVDADSADYSHWVSASEVADAAGIPVEADRDWVWQEKRMATLLTTADTDLLFVSGTAPNMRQFLSEFDHVILLSAPAEVMVERLATRTTNSYGKRPEEVARALGLIASVEPLLRRIADHEIVTTVPVEEVIESILTAIV